MRSLTMLYYLHEYRGQANLAASTSDFGRYGLIASGKSTTAIFTSTIDGAVSDSAISFNIDAPTAIAVMARLHDRLATCW